MINFYNKIYTAIITPMLNNISMSIDYTSYFNLIQLQMISNCGIVVLGSTGEGLSISLKEKKKIINFINSLGLLIPTICSIGGYNLQEQIQLINFIEKKYNIHGYMIITPIYSKPGIKGHIAWLSYLISCCSKKVMLYNVPSRTGISINQEILNGLRFLPNIWALKEASGLSGLKVISPYTNFNKNIRIYCGEDNLIYEYIKLGSIGVVSVISNIWPKEMNQYVTKSISGVINNYDLFIWRFVATSCFEVPNPILVKKWLYINKKIISSTIRLPLVLSEIDDNIKNLYLANYFIKYWYSLNN